jgi:hypothetical protein
MEAVNARVEAPVAPVDGKLPKMSKLQSTVLHFVNKAASGDQTATAKLLALVDQIETSGTGRQRPYPLSAPDIEVVRATYERMKEIERQEEELSVKKDSDRDDEE